MHVPACKYEYAYACAVFFSVNPEFRVADARTPLPSTQVSVRRGVIPRREGTELPQGPRNTE